MSTTAAPASLHIDRVFTLDGQRPEDGLEWELCDVRIDGANGQPVFSKSGVHVPKGMSTTARNILAQKYMRPSETSMEQVVRRITSTIGAWGAEQGYFATELDRLVFEDEIAWLLYHQYGAFNSPVWFNIGVPDVPPAASACFIMQVDDSMDSIFDWWRNEGEAFRGGSGVGVNLSRLRSRGEPYSRGGKASGPLGYMAVADHIAGTVHSGGRTRRPAKMVLLDITHPDVEDFIWCKAREEGKARALVAAGYDAFMDGEAAANVMYQNANLSVRLTDEFMRAVQEDAIWELQPVRGQGEVKQRQARELFRAIAQAAWECADPGVQFDTTINRWHTIPASGRINASNPCSEFLSVDNSACNLASLNLMKFFDPHRRSFDWRRYQDACALFILAQDILVDKAAYPLPELATNAQRQRQLGLGFTNLGAVLMAAGLPYDSPQGRLLAASLAAQMHAAASVQSMRLAEALGAYADWAPNADAHRRVHRMHAQAAAELPIADAAGDRLVLQAAQEAQRVWQRIAEVGSAGMRNSHLTCIAPTGTISFLMGCSTTGVEPEFALVKTKMLAGGGVMRLVNDTVPVALRALGYTAEQIERIVGHIEQTGSAQEAPDLRPEHRPVFACAVGDAAISPRAHLLMVAAVTPFLSGAVSKTVNMPNSATVQDVEDVYMQAWQLGIKCVALYRDGCKVFQPLQAPAQPTSAAPEPAPVIQRRRLPRQRSGHTRAFQVADLGGYLTCGEYPDGQVGEIFLKLSKQGSTLAGFGDAFSMVFSIALQYGVPLEVLVGKLIGTAFAPAGITDDPDVRLAASALDYVARRLAIDYLDEDTRHALGIYTVAERAAALQGSPAAQVAEAVEIAEGGDLEGPLCTACGSPTQRSGSCHVCVVCGTTSGCS